MKALSLITFAWLMGGATIAAQAPGEPYLALGTEPFWGLSIERDRMTFDVNDERPVTVVRPARERMANGYRYRTPRMVVDIVRVDCNDGMSDRTFEHEVTVRLDGRRFTGCGGAILPPETLAGTGWGFEAIAGTRITGDLWSISFAPERRLSEEDDFRPGTYALFTPCGESRGPYSRSGAVLRLGPPRTVPQACTERDRSVDARLSRILSVPGRIAFRPDGTFVMSNGHGTLRLTP